MANLRIHELPAQERPREKLARLGASALSDSELIAILLRTGMRGANAIDVARNLLAQFKSLFGLGSRLARESLSKTKIDTPELVYEMLGAEMRALTRESLRVILLDAKYHL